MQIYAFVGKTGTGKSYNAQQVAKQNDISYIIDDAILIKDTKVIAGRSAKTEKSKIASVKAAIFLDDARANEMKEAIKNEKVDKILILGTSDEMVEKIANNLSLGEIYKTIYIEDVTTEAQREIAQKSRNIEGKHVVPVPTLEIKKQFSGYFMDSLKNLSFKNKDNQKELEITEKTIIRPTYSYLGKYSISDTAISSIVNFVVSKVEGVSKIYKVNIVKFNDGMKLDIDIEVKYGFRIPNVASQIKNAVIYAIDNAAGINIFGINIKIKSISKI